LLLGLIAAVGCGMLYYWQQEWEETVDESIDY